MSNLFYAACQRMTTSKDMAEPAPSGIRVCVRAPTRISLYVLSCEGGREVEMVDTGLGGPGLWRLRCPSHFISDQSREVTRTISRKALGSQGRDLPPCHCGRSACPLHPPRQPRCFLFKQPRVVFCLYYIQLLMTKTLHTPRKFVEDGPCDYLFALIWSHRLHRFVLCRLQGVQPTLARRGLPLYP